MSVLEKVRRWIDGDGAELVLEQAARDAHVKPRSKAEEFIVKIAKAVESVMQNEMVPLPQGTTLIPSEYTIFLNTDDDKEWQGAKRKGLEQGLYHILAERARELAGKKKLETKSFVIEIRVDGNLERGEVRVQHSWEDSNGNKTGVLPRAQPVRPAEVSRPRAVPTNPNITPKLSVLPRYPTETPATVPRAYINPVVPPGQDDGEELTHVATRATELYRLEVWRGGVRQNVVPIFQKEISVGRGSKSRPVDIPLPGDVEISRRHLTLQTDGLGNFWAISEGKNPASVDNFDLPSASRVPIEPGAVVNICSYMLRIQTK